MLKKDTPGQESLEAGRCGTTGCLRELDEHLSITALSEHYLRLWREGDTGGEGGQTKVKQSTGSFMLYTRCGSILQATKDEAGKSPVVAELPRFARLTVYKFNTMTKAHEFYNVCPLALFTAELRWTRETPLFCSGASDCTGI